MDSAALYVSTNVVERLTRPFGSSNQHSSGKNTSDDMNRNFDSERPVMDMAAFMGSLGGVSSGPSAVATSSSATPRARPSSAPRERSSSRPKAHITDEEKDERRQSFEAFLHRNTQTEVRKKKHIGDVRFIFWILLVTF
jgi:hypothetical protein